MARPPSLATWGNWSPVWTTWRPVAISVSIWGTAPSIAVNAVWRATRVFARTECARRFALRDSCNAMALAWTQLRIGVTAASVETPAPRVRCAPRGAAIAPWCSRLRVTARVSTRRLIPSIVGAAERAVVRAKPASEANVSARPGRPIATAPVAYWTATPTIAAPVATVARTRLPTARRAGALRHAAAPPRHVTSAAWILRRIATIAGAVISAAVAVWRVSTASAPARLERRSATVSVSIPAATLRTVGRVASAVTRQKYASMVSVRADPVSHVAMGNVSPSATTPSTAAVAQLRVPMQRCAIAGSAKRSVRFR